MTETDLATMKRLASPTASPDGKLVAYQLRKPIWLRTSSSDLGCTVSMARKEGRGKLHPSLTSTNIARPSRPMASRSIIFANASGSDQLWRYDLGNQTSAQVSNLEAENRRIQIVA